MPSIELGVASISSCLFFFFQAEDGIRDHCVTGVQTCALPISILPISQLPWLIFAYRRALRGHSILPGAVVSALIFMSGHPLIVFVVGLAFIAVVVADAVAQRKLQPLIMATLLGSARAVLPAFALVPALIGASDSWTYKNTSIAGTPY